MRPRVAFVVVLGVLAATIGAAEALDTSAKAPRSSEQPVAAPLVGARLVCPDVVERTVGHVTRITRLGIASIGPTGAVPRAAARTGTVTASTVRPKGPTAPLLASPGRARVVGAPAYQGDVVIDATGKLAPGLAADEL